jgi:hypothetical protein
MSVTMEEDFGVFEVGENDLFTPPIDPKCVVTQRIRFGGRLWAQPEFLFVVPQPQTEEDELQAELNAWQAAGAESLENTLASLSE